jgi:hypothetical protein
MTNKTIKFQRIVLDVKSAFLAPLNSKHHIVCGDKNGEYIIEKKYFTNNTLEMAWDNLYKLIYEKNDK